MLNLETVTFRRLHGLSRSSFLAEEDLRPDLRGTFAWTPAGPSVKHVLRGPLFWQPFADLAAVAITKPNIKTLRLCEMSEDLSLVPPRDRGVISQFLGQLDRLEVFPTADQGNGKPRCRRKSSKDSSRIEWQAWEKVLNGTAKNVKSLLLGLGESICTTKTGSRLGQ